MARQAQPQSDPPHFLADEKIRTVLDGLRCEESLGELRFNERKEQTFF
jgi:hypothetical protein